MVLSIFFLSLLLGVVVLPLVIRWANKWQKFDTIDARKTHVGNISALGGIGILLATVVAGAVFSLALPWQLLIGLFVLFATSLWDDLYQLSAIIRLLVQVVLATYLYGQGWALPVPFSLPVTVFFLVLMVNAYNFIDGINGLAGTLGVLASVVFTMVFLQQGQMIWAAWMAAYAGGLSAFLGFNFGAKARIFMGDNGATVLGLSLGIAFIQILHAPSATATSHTSILSFAAIALPMVDLVRVAVLRLRAGHSPFHADRQHVHHLFVDQGWTHAKVCMLLAGLKTIGLLLLILLVHPLWLLLLLLLSSLLLFGLVGISRNAIKAHSIPAAKELKMSQPAG